MKPTGSHQDFNRISVEALVRNGRTCARKRTLFIQAGWLLCCGLLVGQLQGATFRVTSPADSVAALPDTLRWAILEANANFSSNTIQILPVGTIVLVTNLPTITDNTTIIGPGTNLLTISGDDQFRVFSMSAWTTNTLSGLTIAHGMAWADYPRITYASGISNAGSLKLLNCLVRNCTNGQSCGVGIYNAGDMDMASSIVADCASLDIGMGRGVYNDGTLRMTNCCVSRCVPTPMSEGGGGVLNRGNLTMYASVVECCVLSSKGSGGGILNGGTAVLCGCTVSNNHGGWGGGIANFGSLAMTKSIIMGNYSDGVAGGLWAGGTNWLVGCTIAENRNSSAGGGGIFTGGELRMLNCTVSGNWVYFGGGGIGQGQTAQAVSPTNSTIYLNHCTIVSNTLYCCPERGGGIWNGGGVVKCQKSIIADNDTSDFSGVLTSEGYNLIQNTNGCMITNNETGNIYGADPVLGPLQDNGGPTWTHALLRGSRVIDAASPDDPIAVDQRGIHRPQGLAADIGAFELQYTTPLLERMAIKSCTNSCLVLCGLRGGIYTLQASTNLVTWFNIATLVGDSNGVCEFTEKGTGTCSRRFYRVLLPGPPGSVYIPAPSGIVDDPFWIARTNIYQATETDLPGSGRAEYPFIVPRTGDYVLQATVNAPNAGANSFFLDMDTEPQDPCTIWDIPVTTGYQQRLVSWRGTGTFDHNEFIPKVFHLAEGPHKLIIRGREANTLLQSIAIMQYP